MNQQLFLKLSAILRQPEGSTEHYEGLKVSFSANSAADVKEIQEVINFFNNNLPSDYIDFLKLYNGCSLFKFQDIGGFTFFSATQIIEQNIFYKKEYGEAWDDSIILFCECLGDGDFIGFKNDEGAKYHILDCYHEEKPASWRTIGTSFDLFFEKLLDRKGEKFWLTE